MLRYTNLHIKTQITNSIFIITINIQFNHVLPNSQIFLLSNKELYMYSLLNNINYLITNPEKKIIIPYNVDKDLADNKLTYLYSTDKLTLNYDNIFKIYGYENQDRINIYFLHNLHNLKLRL